MVRNINSFVVSILKKYVKLLDLLFFNFLNLDKFLNVISVLLLLTISLLLALTVFEIKLDNSIVFNIEVSNVAILLKL